MRQSKNAPIDTVLLSSQYSKEREFWLNKLSGNFTRSRFPYDRKSTKPGEYRREALEFRFSGDLSSKLVELSTHQDHRLHIVLAAGLVALIARYSANQDIIVGTPIYKQDIDGEFINTVLVLRNRLEDGMTFKQLLLQMRETILEALENQNFPIETLLYLLNIPGNEDEFPLFDVVVLLENIQKREYIRHIHANILFRFVRTEQSIAGTLEYNPLLYKKDTTTKILSHYTLLMKEAVSSLDLRVSEIDFMSDREKRQVLHEFNDTSTPYPRQKTINELFRDQVRGNGDKLAVMGEENALTYRELNRRANRLAFYLLSRGVKTDEAVGIMADDCPETIVAILGILEAGGAYLPINIDYPLERKKRLLEDANTRILLTVGDPAAGLDCDVVDLQTGGIFENPAGSNERIHDSENLAYIMYTSGSTGIPKGVLVSHRNVVRLVKNTNFIRFQEEDRILKTGVLEFDASTFEIWGALLNGLKLYMLNYDIILAPGSLKESIKKYRINIMWLTSTLFNQMVREDPEVFAGLRDLVVGGDILSPPHINQVRARLPNLRIINGYGPTENTTFSATHLIEREYNESIPIGKPLVNSLVYILDKHGHLLPPGAIGEICVGGDGVARGYLNNPELTAKKFTPYPSISFYNTGDLGRWLPDGNIEFLGRMDHQVKIRGYRIELEEIESHLLVCDSIKDAVVIAGEDEEGDKYLSAYIVLKEGEKELSVKKLRDYLSNRLPEYMVPGYFVHLETFPLTGSGKIDRKALPDPREMMDQGEHYEPPRNEMEKAIVAIWADVLGLDPEKIGIHHNFFELGGNSISILKVQGRLSKEFEQDIAMSDMFMYPTISQLAANISKDLLPGKPCMVRLNHGTNKKNLFIFHPLHGMVYPYKELSRLLEGTFNVYGIQARGLIGSSGLPSTFEEMFEDYFHQIREVQPQGPYILAGYCIGNIFAYETARELEETSQEVEKLILLDISSRFVDYYTRFLKLKEFTANLLEETFFSQGKAPQVLPDDVESRKKQVEDNIKKVLKKYRYKRTVSVPIWIIKAKDRKDRRLTAERSSKMTRGDVVLKETPGDHETIFEFPNVNALAEIFKSRR